METFIEQAESRRKCLSKIVAKYGERVVLLRERKVRLGGFMGLFTREGFELEFYIPPVVGKTVDWHRGLAAGRLFVFTGSHRSFAA